MLSRPALSRSAMARVMGLLTSGAGPRAMCAPSTIRPQAYRGHRSASTLDLSGLHPPIPTPFNQDESIAFDKLEFNIARWNQTPVSGYAVQGSLGEFALLTPGERVEVVRRTKQVASPDKLVIAGSGCESTMATLQLSQQMAEAGADAVMVVTPCYYKTNLTSEALTAHYTKVADHSPVPVILYSVPSNTGLDLAPEVIVRLADHPNIVGIKESSGDVNKLGLLAQKTKDKDFQILAGMAGILMPALSVGSVGGVFGLANVLGQELHALIELFGGGRLEEARSLQLRLIGPNACVTKLFGVAGLKAAMDDLGYYGGPTRLPILPLTQPQRATVRQIFSQSGFM